VKSYLFLFALSCLAPCPPQQHTGQPANPKRGLTSIDTEDEGLLPLTMATPLGLADVVVAPGWFQNWTVVSIGGNVIASGPLSLIPLLPGMLDATVDGGLCGWMFVTVEGSPPQMVEVPVPAATAETLGQAVNKYKASMATAGETLHACIGN
jgi:hypothetical protein